MRAGVYGRQSRGSKKSIGDQIELGQATVRDQGWKLAETYSDEVSASRYGSKVRGGWAEVLSDIEARRLDVLVLWESSRGDRKLTTWSGLLDLCEEHGVKIHVISHERTYDPRNHRDWETLATDGVKSQAEVNLLSARTRRGVAASARAGRPAAGPCPYGYRRVYDPATGALVGQEPDPDTAAVVVEILHRVAKSEPLGRIADDLNARGVPAPGGRQWYRQRVREMALSRTYLGERKHKGEWHSASWPAVIDSETFAQAKTVLDAPGRAKFGEHSRPGKQVHLLTYLATCAKCGDPAHARGKGVNGSRQLYVCGRGCYSVKREPVDELILDLVAAKLSDPEEYAALRQPNDEADADAAAARLEIADLNEKLEEWRESAALGETSPASLATIETKLSERIEAAQARLDAATVPDTLRGWTGREEDVRARWAAAPVQARRAVLRVLEASGLRIQLVPSGQNGHTPITQRVAVSWERNGH